MKQKGPKPRGETLVRVITGVLFIAFLLYAGMNLLRSLEDPFRTALAVSVSVADTTVARGYIVRDELVVEGSGFIVPEVPDGARSAKGSVVAVSYGSGADSAAVTEMRELKMRIERLSAAAAITAEERALRSAEAVQQLALSLANRDLSAAGDNVIEAESLIIGAVDVKSVEGEIMELERELNALMSRIPYNVEITAPEAGVFASEIDGFESISHDDIINLTSEGLDKLFTSPTGSTGAGKMITGSRWYLALHVEEAAAAGLIDAETAVVRITQPVQASFTMNVEGVGRSDGTSRVVVFSCTSGVTQVLYARSVTAELVSGEVEGIRVPKAAIRIEQISDSDTESATFVYLAEGVQATRVRVDIISEFGDAYIVKGEIVGQEKQGAMSILRDGSEIIVKANNLYDGKIVR